MSERHCVNPAKEELQQSRPFLNISGDLPSQSPPPLQASGSYPNNDAGSTGCLSDSLGGKHHSRFNIVSCFSILPEFMAG